METPIPIIDLFAGPGGLGEGFSSEISGKRPFRIAVSVEKDPFAHKTLSLRAFYRYFKYMTDVLKNTISILGVIFHELNL